jgi:hypothetical protein
LLRDPDAIDLEKREIDDGPRTYATGKSCSGFSFQPIGYA